MKEKALATLVWGTGLGLGLGLGDHPQGLSTRRRQVIVENSGHGIGWEAPDAVIGAVREVVTEGHMALAKTGYL